MKFAYQMEDPARANPKENHSLMMIQAAFQAGHAVYHYTPESISLSQNVLSAPCAQITAIDLDKEPHIELGSYEKINLEEMDVIIIRQDPPVDVNYFTNTYFMEMLQKRGVYISNDPVGIRNTPEKLSIFNYPDHIPPTIVTMDHDEVKTFMAIHNEVVAKPLNGFHGHGIIRTRKAEDVREMIAREKEPIMVQPYLPAIKEGNKRILMFGEEIVESIITVPADNDFRIYRGSTDHAYEPTPQERALAEQIAKDLSAQGVLFVGLDFIGPYLTEINVTSTGTLQRIKVVYGHDITPRLIDLIEEHAKIHKNK